ncbi:hypothetical protein PR202_gb20913 [Eleusine coracana subsp. coracana]|uniref:Uncharacterized protein n=1 Tax=Eleusine coracana subsp. coracana TaxID=191504 RepID=A0AAV5FBW3_ELECO|nr:hypothetical protein PR202_gb20913 [Eleusine coracana subsp. coracana]
MLGEGPWEEGEGPDDMWLKMATCVRKVALEVFGVSRGGKQEAKDTWWWNDEVQRAIKEKECFKRLHLDKSAANIEGYKIAKRAAKQAVSVAKGQAYDNLYQRLGTKEGEKDIYRMARIHERKTRDINQIKCIKDGVDRLLVRDEEIKDRWREYFDKLFNGEEGPILELDDLFDDNNIRFVRRIQEAEIEEALKRMKSGKAMDPDGIPIKVYERSMKMEGELRSLDEMRAELAQVRKDIQKLGAARQELTGQVQGLTQDLARSAVDLQQVSALKAEIQEIRHETQHLRFSIELEKKGYAESYEQGQEMQKNLISVASEVEKLRAEVANADKRSWAAVSLGNQGYVGSYGNNKANYATNPYNTGYSTNQANTADSGSQGYLEVGSSDQRAVSHLRIIAPSVLTAVLTSGVVSVWHAMS